MEIILPINNIETIRLFGSYARAEQTVDSDYDILVVLQKSQIISSSIENTIKNLFERPISISWYSKERIEFLFKKGHLFSWHLFLESKCLYSHDFISELGEPAQYTYGIKDVRSLINILLPIRATAFASPRNLIYEAGLLYVCARNIALCSLPSLRNQYNFGTNSPFLLDFPLTYNEFELLKKCRYASSRGDTPPNITLLMFSDYFYKIKLWSQNQLLALKQQFKYGTYQNQV